MEGTFPTAEPHAVETLEALSRMVASATNRAPLDPVGSGVLGETVRESGRDPALRDRMATSPTEYRRLLARLVRAEQPPGADVAGSPPAPATLIATASDGSLLHSPPASTPARQQRRRWRSCARTRRMGP